MGGRRAGQWKRNPGAAHTMARDAAVIPDAHRLLRHLHLMTARPDLPTGPPVGLSRKRPGVAPMPGRAAPRRLAAAPDRQSIIVGVYAGALAQARHLRVLLLAHAGFFLRSRQVSLEF